MKIKTLLAMVGAAIAIPTVLLAQPNTAPIQQLDQTQRQMQMQNPRMLNLSTNTEAPEIYPGENADVGPQHILKSKEPRRTWFEVVADSQYYYSDNVFLSDQGKKVAAPLFVNTIQAAFAPQAFNVGSGQLAPTVGYRSQWFNYGLGGGPAGIDMLDFNAQTAFASVRYQKGLWSVFGEFDFTRLMDQDKYKEAYREYVPTLGIQRLFPINDKLSFSASVQADYHWTETTQTGFNITTNGISQDANDRFDATLLLAAAWQINPHMVLQPFYRFQFTDYQAYNDGSTPSPRARVDFVNTIGTTLTYYFTKNISARIFANYEIKDNDYSKTYDYHKFDGGGGAGLDIRF